MSLQTALKAVGLVVVGLMLLSAFIAMGPVGWVVIGTMVAIGVIQVHRNRRRSEDEAGDAPAYCPNCGADLDAAAYERQAGADSQWKLNYCPECGAPVAPDSSGDAAPRPQNCPDCGALNDPGETECDYCHADL